MDLNPTLTNFEEHMAEQYRGCSVIYRDADKDISRTISFPNAAGRDYFRIQLFKFLDKFQHADVRAPFNDEIPF
jgi:hypothetical protein